MDRRIGLLGATLTAFGLWWVHATGTQSTGTAPRMPYQEYASRIKAASEVAPLKDDLFGEAVSLYNGSTEFTATDIDLPGNDSLPVRLGRRLKIESLPEDAQTFGGFWQWDLDVPMISGTFANNLWLTDQGSGARCTNFGVPQTGTLFDSSEYHHGVQIHIPGESDRDILMGNGDPKSPYPAGAAGNRPLRTKDFDRIDCTQTTSNGFPGEGFVITTSAGLRYTFDVGVTRDAGVIKKPAYGPDLPPDAMHVLGRTKVYLLVSRIEDRFGNAVVYNWSHGKLLSIAASDGRQITMAYDGANISSATAHGKMWTYSMSTAGLKVTLPDASYWLATFNGTDRPNYPALDDGGSSNPSCPEPLEAYFPPSSLPQVTLRHPSGAVGTFNFNFIRHRRTGVPANACHVVYQNGETIVYEMGIPVFFDVYSLVSKKITGPGLPERAWSYGYEVVDRQVSGGGFRCCQEQKSVVVRQPEGVMQEYRFGIQYGKNDGRLIATYTRDSDESIVAAEENLYLSEAQAANVAFPTYWGYPTGGSDDDMAMRVRPLVATLISRDGWIAPPAYDVPPYPTPPPPCSGPDCPPPPPPPNCDPVTGICQNVESSGSTTSSVSMPADEVAADIYMRTITAFDNFARPTSQREESSLGYTRTRTFEYKDDFAQWVLGQPYRELVNNTEVSKTDYDARALPWKISSFGNHQRTLLYDALGRVTTVQDGAGNATQLTSWKRGIPQMIRHPATPEAPAGGSQSAWVNDLGWIDWVVDERGYKTCYDYDGVGRITRVTQPSDTEKGVCDESRWNPTIQTFVPVEATEYGISAGHWKQTISTGNARKITYFDAMFRPLVQEMYDASNATATRSISVKRYDLSGQLAYQSYALSSLDSYLTPTLGTRYLYDALGRNTHQQQDSELGPLTTTTRYLPGGKVEVTNPRQKVTTTAFQAFDKPSIDSPVRIEQPENAVVQIARDVFGKPEAITRSHVNGSLALTRAYAYDVHHRLCRTAEPETGVTLTGYDANSNVAWTAAGLPASTTCAQSELASVVARRVSRLYDGRNRVQQLRHPDGRGDQDWTYYENGLPNQVVTYNGFWQSEPVINVYAYNSLGKLGGQGDSVRQDGWYTWSIGYGYDRNGSQSVIIQPDGEALSYAPNALGQATQVASPVTTYAHSVLYYPNGAVKQFVYGNAMLHSMWQNTRQLPQRSRDAWSAQVGLDDAYAYDENGNVMSITDNAALAGRNSSRTMTYDGLDRLKTVASSMYGAGGASYEYDVLDNLTRVTAPGRDHHYCYDTNWRLTSLQTSLCASGGSAAISLLYDVQGNLSNKNGREFNFTFGNRLHYVPNVESYRYDAFGRRIMAWAVNGGNILSQYGQDGVLRYQSDGRRSMWRNYIYLAGSLIAERETAYGTATHTIKYQHTDALGSPVVVTDAYAFVTERNEYEPYGAVLGTKRDGPGYTGHVLDTQTGLNYMQQRYYDPSIGRFLSTDPVAANHRVGSNFNRYWYANNNPYLFVDPDGRFGCAATRIVANCLTGAGAAMSALAVSGLSARPFSSDRVSGATSGPNAARLTKDANTVVGMANRSGDREFIGALNSVRTLRISDEEGPRANPSLPPGNASADYATKTLTFFKGYFAAGPGERFLRFIHETYHLTDRLEAVRQKDPECGWGCPRPDNYEEATKRAALEFKLKWHLPEDYYGQD